MKSTFKGTTHESVFKQDGSLSYDLKWDILEKQTKVKGLNFATVLTGNAAPSDKVPEAKVGLDFANEDLKYRQLTNVRDFVTEITVVHKCCSRWLIGGNFILDANKKLVTAYNAGVVWEPADKVLIGVRHESVNKEKLAIGNLYLHYYHHASAFNKVGTEFKLDWQKKEVTAKLGLDHKFDDNTSGKVKVDQTGKIDALLKHKFSDVVTASAVTSINVKDFSTGKSRTLPLGLGFDLKL